MSLYQPWHEPSVSDSYAQVPFNAKGLRVARKQMIDRGGHVQYGECVFSYYIS